MFANRRILLIIGGGIAAYKSLELIRALKKRGASVRVVLTRAAAEFVTPLSVAALSGGKAHSDLFDPGDDNGMEHISLSRGADLVVAAPATADMMAKLAGGLANDLASTVLLANNKALLMAPAMNMHMWSHPATRRNHETLARDGVNFTGPDEGDMACGEHGLGRMSEPDAIMAVIEKLLEQPGAPLALAGRRIVITSGPTREPIDPVRFLSNRSSGRQGSAIADALSELGAKITFITGPGAALPQDERIEITKVETAVEMLGAVQSALPADAAIFVAAVADWRVADIAKSKYKKTADAPQNLQLVENPDILATIAALPDGERPQLVIGFAAETDDLLQNAALKLARKGCEWIIANDVSKPGVMGGERNQIHILDAKGTESWPEMDKRQLAQKLAAKIARFLNGEGPAS